MIQLRNIIIAILLLIILVGLRCRKEEESEVAEIAEHSAEETNVSKAEHVGRRACIDCHKRQYDLYVGSDHDMAMDVATAEAPILTRLFTIRIVVKRVWESFFILKINCPVLEPSFAI